MPLPLLPWQQAVSNRSLAEGYTHMILGYCRDMEKDIAATEANVARHFANCPDGESCPDFKTSCRELAAMRVELAAMAVRAAESMTDEN
jgi:hypothetical protein